MFIQQDTIYPKKEWSTNKLQDGRDLKTSKKSQTPKATYCMIPFICNIQTRKIHKD